MTGNQSYFPATGDATTIGITIKQKFLMDFVMTNSSRFGWNTAHCLEEAEKAFEIYLKVVNNA